ncbi:hypothetical protein [Clostridium tagluense]|uniref:Uncharacterized protein n=1 Tax=Clostridium tagluense TaxID=360422 RepID=A0A401ULL9_9CLOT|nr:hypothetical protein [Clostridium tagluense]GCD10426.1 hypothetical protein Ctaglu_20490 [Clostridium tagluense]
MLITKTVMLKLNGQNVKHLENLGYKIERRQDKWGSFSFKTGTEIEVKVEHLKEGSHINIKCSCDYCLKKR